MPAVDGADSGPDAHGLAQVSLIVHLEYSHHDDARLLYLDGLNPRSRPRIVPSPRLTLKRTYSREATEEKKYHRHRANQSR